MSAGASSTLEPIRRGIRRVIGPRALFGLAMLGVVTTWIMLLIGGTVNPTQSSLACPWDPSHLWSAPSCGGLPMEGGVVFEHGHRLWGWVVGWTTVLVMLGAWASDHVHKGTKWIAFGAVWLVLAQGALGGLTVLVGLNPILSTGHLVVGYSFLATMVLLAWRLHPSRATDPHRGGRLPRGALIASALVVLAQILLGGALRHFGPGGVICGTDPIGCNGQGLWPQMGLQQLHMIHRFVGYAATVMVVWVAWSAMRRARTAGREPIARLAWVPLVLVVLQAAIGIFTVVSGKVVWIVMFHTAFGGLLLAALVAVFLGFGPLGERRVGAPADAAPRPAGDDPARRHSQGALA